MVEFDWSMPSESIGSPVYNLSGEPLGAIDHIMLAQKFRRTLCGAPLQHLLGSSERYYPVPWTKLV